MIRVLFGAGVFAIMLAAVGELFISLAIAVLASVGLVSVVNFWADSHTKDHPNARDTIERWL